MISAHSFNSSLISPESSRSFLYFIWWSRLAQKSMAMVRIWTSTRIFSFRSEKNTGISMIIW